MTATDRDPNWTLIYTAIVANALVLAALGYALLAERQPTAYWAVPLVWITVGVWALIRVSPPPATRRTKVLAGAVAGGYFIVLGFVGGLFGPASGPTTGLLIQATELPPGWNPAVLYAGEYLQFAIIPYTAFGYAVLAYLIYVTAVEAKHAVAGGLLGLFSCVSCTLPVIAALVGGVVGGGGAVAQAAIEFQSYAISTAVFVVTVGLLSYRPGLGQLRRWLS